MANPTTDTIKSKTTTGDNSLSLGDTIAHEFSADLSRTVASAKKSNNVVLNAAGLLTFSNVNERGEVTSNNAGDDFSIFTPGSNVSITSNLTDGGDPPDYVSGSYVVQSSTANKLIITTEFTVTGEDTGSSTIAIPVSFSSFYRAENSEGAYVPNTNKNLAVPKNDTQTNPEIKFSNFFGTRQNYVSQLIGSLRISNDQGVDYGYDPDPYAYSPTNLTSGDIMYFNVQDIGDEDNIDDTTWQIKWLGKRYFDAGGSIDIGDTDWYNADVIVINNQRLLTTTNIASNFGDYWGASVRFKDNDGNVDGEYSVYTLEPEDGVRVAFSFEFEPNVSTSPTVLYNTTTLTGSVDFEEGQGPFSRSRRWFKKDNDSLAPLASSDPGVAPITISAISMNMTADRAYVITTVGDVNWKAIGSFSSQSVGTVFNYNGVDVTGTGQVVELTEFSNETLETYIVQPEDLDDQIVFRVEDTYTTFDFAQSSNTTVVRYFSPLTNLVQNFTTTGTLRLSDSESNTPYQSSPTVGYYLESSTPVVLKSNFNPAPIDNDGVGTTTFTWYRNGASFQTDVVAANDLPDGVTYQPLPDGADVTTGGFSDFYVTADVVDTAVHPETVQFTSPTVRVKANPKYAFDNFISSVVEGSDYTFKVNIADPVEETVSWEVVSISDADGSDVGAQVVSSGSYAMTSTKSQPETIAFSTTNFHKYHGDAEVGTFKIRLSGYGESVTSNAISLQEAPATGTISLVVTDANTTGNQAVFENSTARLTSVTINLTGTNIRGDEKVSTTSNYGTLSTATPTWTYAGDDETGSYSATVTWTPDEVTNNYTDRNITISLKTASGGVLDTSTILVKNITNYVTTGSVEISNLDGTLFTGTFGDTAYVKVSGVTDLNGINAASWKYRWHGFGGSFGDYLESQINNQGVLTDSGRELTLLDATGGIFVDVNYADTLAAPYGPTTSSNIDLQDSYVAGPIAPLIGPDSLSIAVDTLVNDDLDPLFRATYIEYSFLPDGTLKFDAGRGGEDTFESIFGTNEFDTGWASGDANTVNRWLPIGVSVTDSTTGGSGPYAIKLTNTSGVPPTSDSNSRILYATNTTGSFQKITDNESLTGAGGYVGYVSHDFPAKIRIEHRAGRPDPNNANQFLGSTANVVRALSDFVLNVTASPVDANTDYKDDIELTSISSLNLCDITYTATASSSSIVEGSDLVYSVQITNPTAETVSWSSLTSDDNAATDYPVSSTGSFSSVAIEKSPKIYKVNTTFDASTTGSYTVSVPTTSNNFYSDVSDPTSNLKLQIDGAIGGDVVSSGTIQILNKAAAAESNITFSQAGTLFKERSELTVSINTSNHTGNEKLYIDTTDGTYAPFDGASPLPGEVEDAAADGEVSYTSTWNPTANVYNNVATIYVAEDPVSTADRTVNFFLNDGAANELASRAATFKNITDTAPTGEPALVNAGDSNPYNNATNTVRISTGTIADSDGIQADQWKFRYYQANDTAITDWTASAVASGVLTDSSYDMTSYYDTGFYAKVEFKDNLGYPYVRDTSTYTSPLKPSFEPGTDESYFSYSAYGNYPVERRADVYVRYDPDGKIYQKSIPNVASFNVYATTVTATLAHSKSTLTNSITVTNPPPLTGVRVGDILQITYRIVSSRGSDTNSNLRSQFSAFFQGSDVGLTEGANLFPNIQDKYYTLDDSAWVETDASANSETSEIFPGTTTSFFSSLNTDAYSAKMSTVSNNEETDRVRLTFPRNESQAYAIAEHIYGEGIPPTIPNNVTNGLADAYTEYRATFVVCKSGPLSHKIMLQAANAYVSYNGNGLTGSVDTLFSITVDTPSVTTYVEAGQWLSKAVPAGVSYTLNLEDSEADANIARYPHKFRLNNGTLSDASQMNAASAIITSNSGATFRLNMGVDSTSNYEFAGQLPNGPSNNTANNTYSTKERTHTRKFKPKISWERSTYNGTGVGDSNTGGFVTMQNILRNTDHAFLPPLKPAHYLSGEPTTYLNTYGHWTLAANLGNSGINAFDPITYDISTNSPTPEGFPITTTVIASPTNTSPLDKGTAEVFITLGNNSFGRIVTETKTSPINGVQFEMDYHLKTLQPSDFSSNVASFDTSVLNLIPAASLGDQYFGDDNVEIKVQGRTSDTSDTVVHTITEQDPIIIAIQGPVDIDDGGTNTNTLAWSTPSLTSINSAMYYEIRAYTTARVTFQSDGGVRFEYDTYGKFTDAVLGTWIVGSSFAPADYTIKVKNSNSFTVPTTGNGVFSPNPIEPQVLSTDREFELDLTVSNKSGATFTGQIIFEISGLGETIEIPLSFSAEIYP